MAGTSKNIETNQGIVGPLNFSTENSEPIKEQLFPTSLEIPCLFCEKSFKFNVEKHDYLAHLYLNHRLIIGDEDQVAIFHEYLTYWNEKFGGNDENIAEFCTTMVMDQLPDGTPSKNEKYYLLCDVLPQDYELRQKLQKKRLELALAQHQLERTDGQFERSCLFCRDVITTNRCDVIEHLFSKHFLQLGKPENLLFIDELIDTVQSKLNDLICLFCEKVFKDRSTLKEHMRKKGHKRINPDNEDYDRFFLIHYQKQQHGASKKKSKPQKIVQKDIQQEKKINKPKQSDIFDDHSDSNWSDWEGDKQDITCLFCSEKNIDYGAMKNHIKTAHRIDFDKQTEKLSFYERVKVVNYVRRKIYTLQCVKCDETFEDSAALHTHLDKEDHYFLGESKDWNLPQYFFSTYEDDAFLHHLDDFNLDDDDCNLSNLKVDDSSVTIYSEERKVAINLDAEALSRESL